MNEEIKLLIMKEQFVPYELALKLKELGFKDECLRTYDEDGNFCTKITQRLYCKAPLWQQAFDWCLNKLNLIESYAIIIDSDSYSLVIMDDYYDNIKENLTQSLTKIECLEKLIEIVSNENI